ncbi:hypothetical protein [Thermodesulfovibrio sp. 3462-1]
MQWLKGSGYTIKDACKALGISRSSYYSAARGKGVNEREVSLKG